MNQNDYRKYILYAEDDPDDQETLKEMLSSIDTGLEVISFNNGLELIQHLSSMKENEYYPCFIMLDLNMPVWDGIRTLQALKNDPHSAILPVIVFTTSNLQRDADLAVRMGAEAFITKPIRHREFGEVSKVLAKYCEDAKPRQKKHLAAEH